MGRVSISSQHGRLYLNANFPRRDGQPGNKQSRLALRLPDTPANRKVAAKRQAYVQRQLDQGTFDWDDHQESAKGPTWREAINALYRKRVVLGRTGESTWEINYAGRLRQAPMTDVITADGIQQFMSRWPRHTCSYKETFYLLKDLCQLVNVSFPELPTPTYKKDGIKDVPTDQEIIDWVQNASGQAAWHFGIMATYGLRPHELEGCQFIDDKHRLNVPEDSKTGSRIVIPLHAEWVELFSLREEQRRTFPTTRPDSASKWLSHVKRKLGISWTPYALRHAYAARLWKVGGGELDIYTAARLMGHSVKEHERTYRAHIAPWTIAQAAEDAISRNLDQIAKTAEQQYESPSLSKKTG